MSDCGLIIFFLVVSLSCFGLKVISTKVRTLYFTLSDTGNYSKLLYVLIRKISDIIKREKSHKFNQGGEIPVC